MSMELEDQIRGWVDDQVDGVAPVTLDEVMGGSSSKATGAGGLGGSTTRRRWLFPAVAAAAALVFGAVGLAVLGGEDAPEQVLVGTSGEDDSSAEPPVTVEGDAAAEDGFITFTEPTFGWTWEQPASWTSQSERDYCTGLGFIETFVTNTERRYSHPVVGDGCNTIWMLPDPVPEGFVGVSVISMAFGTELGDFPDKETVFPLAFDDLQPFDDAMHTMMFPGAVQPTRSIVINHEGRRYGVITFEGAGVSHEDRTALVRMIESIDPSDLPPADPITFAWVPDDAVPGAVTTIGEPPQPHAELEFERAADAVADAGFVEVTTYTHRAALDDVLLRMEADGPDATETSLLGNVPTRRTRIEVRGVAGVHDRAQRGEEIVSRVLFFDYDNLAVEVVAHNVADDDLYRIIEGLRLVAPGRSNG